MQTSDGMNNLLVIGEEDPFKVNLLDDNENDDDM